MKTPVTEMLGVKAPILAFSRQRDVVAAVSKAGGFGVLGATMSTPEQLDEDMTWLDRELGGLPYGADILVPARQLDAPMDDLVAQIPRRHVDFMEGVLRKYGVEPSEGEVALDLTRGFVTEPEKSGQLLDVAFQHQISLIASALGPPSPEMIEAARAKDAVVAGLAGARRHSEKLVEAGVDVVVAVGYEAGGHTGDVGSMVITPEIVDAVAPVPVLAAGGIATGRQVAAALALGAAGVWAGSVWLGSPEAETGAAIRKRIPAATSSDTVRDKTRSGKPTRQLRSAWHEEWNAQEGMQTLPMPLQMMLVNDAFGRIGAAAESGHAGAEQLDSYWIGQCIGLMDTSRSSGEIVADMIEEVESSIDRLGAIAGSD